MDIKFTNDDIKVSWYDRTWYDPIINRKCCSGNVLFKKNNRENGALKPFIASPDYYMVDKNGLLISHKQLAEDSGYEKLSNYIILQDTSDTFDMSMSILIRNKSNWQKFVYTYNDTNKTNDNNYHGNMVRKSQFVEQDVHNFSWASSDEKDIVFQKNVPIQYIEIPSKYSDSIYGYTKDKDGDSVSRYEWKGFRSLDDYKWINRAIIYNKKKDESFITRKKYHVYVTIGNVIYKRLAFETDAYKSIVKYINDASIKVQKMANEEFNKFIKSNYPEIKKYCVLSKSIFRGFDAHHAIMSDSYIKKDFKNQILITDDDNEIKVKDPKQLKELKKLIIDGIKDTVSEINNQKTKAYQLATKFADLEPEVYLDDETGLALTPEQYKERYGKELKTIKQKIS